MRTFTGTVGTLPLVAALAAGVPAATSHTAGQKPRTHAPVITPQMTGCSPAQRRETLRTVQTSVLEHVPVEIESLERAVAPGGQLAGWNLSHGYVVLDTAGAVAVDNIKAKEPVPQLLLYAPSPSSAPKDWLDFDGPDNPYRLVGWAYFGMHTPESRPPARPCIAEAEWFVHEAGWHLKDGGMQLTPGAASEPPRPPALEIHMWHPRVWDIHFWKGEDGVPTVAFVNPKASVGGKKLPDGSFFSARDRKHHKR